MSDKIERKRAELAQDEAIEMFVAAKRANWEARDKAIADYLKSVKVSDLVGQFAEIKEQVDEITREYRAMLQDDRDKVRSIRQEYRETWRQPVANGAAPEAISKRVGV